MKVLITGATGQLGQALQQTAPVGFEVHGLPRAELDICNEASVERVMSELNPEVIVNCAAYTAVDNAEADARNAFLVNEQAVGILAQACRRSGAKLIHISTDFVFDGAQSRAYRPQDRRNPLSVYGRSKAAGEDLLAPDDLIIRTSWVYGGASGNFLATMLRLMRSRGAVRVVADQIGSPTWSVSLARTVWGLLSADASGVYHYSDAGIASWYDFAVAISDEAHTLGLLDRSAEITPISTADYPTAAIRPPFSLLDSSDTHEFLATASVHWRHNLRSALAMLEPEEVKA